MYDAYLLALMGESVVPVCVSMCVCACVRVRVCVRQGWNHKLAEEQ